MEVDLLDVGKRAPLAGVLGALRILPELVSHPKTVYDLSVHPLPDGRSLLSGLMRTATTDEHARRWFRRYWTFGVGSGGPTSSFTPCSRPFARGPNVRTHARPAHSQRKGMVETKDEVVIRHPLGAEAVGSGRSTAG